MNGLRSDYLEKLAKICLNVVACDELKVLNYGDKYICNLDRSYEEGSHYIAISIKEENSIYFDSYGNPCLNEYIKNALVENHITEMYYSAKQIQNSISLFCGYFCLAFLICDERNIKLEDFLSLFKENDVRSNEKLASEIIIQSLIDKTS